jgi:hypothetical protein
MRSNDKGEMKAGTGCLILILAVFAIGMIAVLNIASLR